MKIDYHKWAKLCREDYKEEQKSISYWKGKKECHDYDPCFSIASRVFQKRGYLLLGEFISICEWKTARGKEYYDDFNEKDIKTRTENVIKETSDKNRISELRNIKGIGVPIASAILTAIFPKHYCVIDYRSWRCLLWITNQVPDLEIYYKYSTFLDGIGNYSSFRVYDSYLKEIRDLAKKQNPIMSPRELELAIYYFDECKGTTDNVKISNS